MISVGRLASARKRSNARASIRRSLASPTLVTFQPRLMNLVAMSSLKANEVLPSIAPNVVPPCDAQGRPQLAMLLEGIDWRMPQRTWQPEAAG